MSPISIIVAVDQNNAIGKDNQLLCYLPNDLKYFKEKTLESTIIMGRKTYQSLPKGALPHRRNIVITENRSFEAPNCEIAHSVAEALELCANDKKVFIIGGASLYHTFIELADKLYVTHIAHKFDGADTFFPTIDKDIWIETSSIKNNSDEKNKYAHNFVTYERQK